MEASPLPWNLKPNDSNRSTSDDLLPQLKLVDSAKYDTEASCGSCIFWQKSLGGYGKCLNEGANRALKDVGSFPWTYSEELCLAKGSMSLHRPREK